MGEMTRGTIVTRGLQHAGNTSLSALANDWLNAWLDSVYTSWPWPFLKKRRTGLALSTGTHTLSFGNGSSGVTLRVQRVLDPVRLYNSTYTARSLVRLRSEAATPVEDDEVMVDSTVNRGLPNFVKAIPDESTKYKWSLIFNRAADKDYLLAVDYIDIPAQLTGDSDIPRYPNDRTMMKAVEVEALRHQKFHGQYRAELDVLAGMVVDDRLKHGSILGMNDEWGLDPNTFR